MRKIETYKGFIKSVNVSSEIRSIYYRANEPRYPSSSPKITVEFTFLERGDFDKLIHDYCNDAISITFQKEVSDNNEKRSSIKNIRKLRFFTEFKNLETRNRKKIYCYPTVDRRGDARAVIKIVGFKGGEQIDIQNKYPESNPASEYEEKKNLILGKKICQIINDYQDNFGIEI